MKLFYLILGATPEGRNIEQHDVFFGIAENLKDMVPHIVEFWPEAKGEIHIDAYQIVEFVDGYEVIITGKDVGCNENNLFFINLGGYQPGTFGELHEQRLMAGKSMAEVIKRIKQSDFYKKVGFRNAASHIDDKHGVDIDDIFKVSDILPGCMKEKYSIRLKKSRLGAQKNVGKVGYFKLDKI